MVFFVHADKHDCNNSVTFAFFLLLHFRHHLSHACDMSECIAHMLENRIHSCFHLLRHMASFAKENCLSFKRRDCESLLYKELQASNHGPFQMSN